jgi:hypothetical protein
MAIPTSNTLTLFLSNTTGSLSLSAGPNTAFRIDQGNGLTIAAPASLEGLTLTSMELQLSFAAPFSGQVSVSIVVGPGSFMMVGGTFTPGSAQVAWVGQSGSYEQISTAGRISID